MVLNLMNSRFLALSFYLALPGFYSGESRGCEFGLSMLLSGDCHMVIWLVLSESRNLGIWVAPPPLGGREAARGDAQIPGIG